MTELKPKFTAGEKAQIAWYLARMLKRGIADDGTGNVYQRDLEKKVEAIERRALRRTEREAQQSK